MRIHAMHSIVRRAGRTAALAPLLGLLACAAPPAPPDPLGVEEAVRSEAPMGGLSLDERRTKLMRAQRDLGAFRATVETLRQRGDRGGQSLFRGFVQDYVYEHLEPLLSADWQSDHAELQGLDVGIRLLLAEVYLLLDDSARMQGVIWEIEERYEGRDELVVDYPVGERSSLKEALEILAKRKWWG